MDTKAELTIEKLTYQGDGIARQDGMVWFIPYTAPGEIVEVELTMRKSSFCRGRVLAVIEPSPLRREPECSYFGNCGGCHWQHLEYSAQVQSKSEILAEMSVRAGFNIKKVHVTPSPAEFGYRNRISLQRIGKSIGYFENGSQNLISVKDCPIAVDSIREWLADIPLSKAEIRRLPERFELRVNDDGSTVTLHQAEDGPFSQANQEGNLLLKHAIRNIVLSRHKEPNIFDLFCGDGNLSFPLVEDASSITGWDISQVAIEIARRKAAAKSNAAYRVGNVADISDALKKTAPEMDVLILDPPREGIKNEAAELAALNIPTVIYVSCNPAALMRDLKVFTGNGYSLESLEGFDMFPQTFHMESIALLVKTIHQEKQSPPAGQ